MLKFVDSSKAKKSKHLKNRKMLFFSIKNIHPTLKAITWKKKKKIFDAEVTFESKTFLLFFQKVFFALM